MVSEILFTTGLPEPKPAEFTELGQYRLATRASLLDPSQPAKDAAEGNAFKATDISRLKGQELTCAANAKLIAVNLRWITYAMKEGNVRAITQNAKESLKLSTLQKATIIDLVMLDKGGSTEPGVLVCLDEAAHVTVFELSSSKKVDLEFSKSYDSDNEEFNNYGVMVSLANDDQDNRPHRVVAHPGKRNMFMLMHVFHIGVWSLTKLGQMKPREEEKGFQKYKADTDLDDACSQVIVNESNGLARLRDLTFSANGSCIIALSDSSVFTYSLASERIGEEDSIQMLQQLALTPGPASDMGFHSLHVLGSGGPSDGNASEVLVLASRTEHGCDLLAYELTVSNAGSSTSSFFLGRRLLQTLHIDMPSSAAGEPVLLDVNREPRDTLCIAFKDVVLVMPLAFAWSAGPSLPFPNVRRILLPDPVHQLTTMLGKSFSNAETALFLFSATNFTREKDKLPGCHVVVHELQPSVIQRRPAAPPLDQDVGESDAGDDTGADVVAEEPASASAEQAAGSDLEPAMQQTSEALESAVPADNDADQMELSATEPGEPETEQIPEAEPERELGRLSKSQMLEEEDMHMGHPTSATEELRSKPDKEADAGAASSADAADVVTAAAEGEATAPVDGDVDGEGDDGAIDEAENAPKDAEKKDGSTSCDWGIMKQCAASFVKGLDKRRPEMAERLLGEVAAQLKATLDLAGAERDLVEQALAKVHEAREVQASGERGLSSAVKKATDSWFDASTAATQGLLQKELTKISDGVATSLAQQLSQSRKFSEALARGVQRCSGAATKQALEALRPSRAIQESLSSAMMDALNESLGPVFRTELRSHFEQELAPLIAQRVGEMMSTLRDKMGECLGGIAAEHEQAAQRLARDIGPIVAQELRDVERTLARRSAESSSGASGAEGFSEEQLEDLVQSVHSEIVAPLHSRIRELTAQVRSLREEAKDLDRKWASYQRGEALSSAASAPASAASVAAAEEDEEAQVKDVERLFRDGKEQDAFVKAMKLQQQAKRVDFLGRLCTLAGSPADWIESDGRDDGCPLSMQVKMLLMLSLAQQLQGRGAVFCSDAERTDKVEWINELWFAFDPQDSSVSSNSGSLCTQLMDALEKASEAGSQGAGNDSLRKLKKGVKHAARLMAS